MLQAKTIIFIKYQIYVTNYLPNQWHGKGHSL